MILSFISVLLLFSFCQRIKSCPTLNDCSGHGSCSIDGFICECDGGFRGSTCAIGPPALVKNKLVPGQVAGDADSSTNQNAAYFKVEAASIEEGHVIRVEPADDAFVVHLYGAIGVAPQQGDDLQWTSDTQFSAASQAGGPKQFSVTTTAPFIQGSSDKDLYIAVTAPASQIGSVSFNIIHIDPDELDGGSIVSGMSDVAFALTLVGSCCCCLICIAAIAGVVLMMGKKKKNPRAISRQNIAMQPVHQQQQQLTSDYPSNGNNMMMAGQTAALSNDYPSGANGMDGNMMPGYAQTMGTAESSQFGRPMESARAGYDNTSVMNPYGTEMQNPYDINGGGGGTGQMMPGYGGSQQSSGYIAQQQQFGGNAFGGDFGGNGGPNDMQPMW